jgi:6-phosphogluconate dehydrogenase (decarboxylating)
MRTDRQLTLAFSVLLGLHVVTSLAAVALFGRMAPAIERIIEENVASVSDSGEGRWTVQTAVEQGVPVPVLSAALYARFASRGNDTFANKVLSAMRSQFGGHQEKRKDGA